MQPTFPSSSPAATSSPADPLRAPTVQLSPGDVAIQVQSVAGAHPVSLPGASDQDWIVVAVGTSNTVVRSRSGNGRIGSPQFYPRSGSVAGGNGPYSITWSGGSSPSAATSSRWLSAGGTGAGFRITTSTGAYGVLTVYMGAWGAMAHVTARLEGGGGTSANLNPEPTGTGYVLSIPFHSTRASDRLYVDVNCDSGGGVGVAGVELQ